MKREEFLAEIWESILLPYEANEIPEEQIIGEFQNEFELEFFEKFIEALEERDLILDLACGDGRHTTQLSKYASRVIALDLSPNNLRMAMKKCRNWRNVDLVGASMFQLPFQANVFDGIWFSQAFEYVPPDRREGIFTYLKSVLKPKGILYMSIETWMYPSVLNSLRELLGDLKLYVYWKFIKGKPLLWGEFIYHISPTSVKEIRYSGWHYHVHTDMLCVKRLLRKFKFDILRMRLGDGYIYLLCRNTLPMK